MVKVVNTTSNLWVYQYGEGRQDDKLYNIIIVA